MEPAEVGIGEEWGHGVGGNVYTNAIGTSPSFRKTGN
jgi:hypothetical protein